jgi:hypothetical protein
MVPGAIFSLVAAEVPDGAKTQRLPHRALRTAREKRWVETVAPIGGTYQIQSPRRGCLDQMQPRHAVRHVSEG